MGIQTELTERLVNNGGEWFKNGWFELLEDTCGPRVEYEDGEAQIGLMRWKEGDPFEYWIGYFFPEMTEVPEGFSYVDFNASDLGVAWVYGKENEVYGLEHLCAERCLDKGFNIITDEEGALWFFERYVCPRFTSADEQGKVILDICHFVEKA